MNAKIKKPINLIAVSLLVAGLAMPSLVQAGNNHSHQKHYKQPQQHFNQHKHHSHSKKYVQVYRQPPVYYQPYYPQPQYQYNYYSPAPVYVVPPRVNMGINTGNMDFMLRF